MRLSSFTESCCSFLVAERCSGVERDGETKHRGMFVNKSVNINWDILGEPQAPENTEATVCGRQSMPKIFSCSRLRNYLGSTCAPGGFVSELAVIARREKRFGA